MYRCRKQVTYFAVNQLNFQSEITDLTQNYLKPKYQQDKASFFQESNNIQAITCTMLFIYATSYSKEFGAKHPSCRE